MSRNYVVMVATMVITLDDVEFPLVNPTATEIGLAMVIAIDIIIIIMPKGVVVISMALTIKEY